MIFDLFDTRNGIIAVEEVSRRLMKLDEKDREPALKNLANTAINELETIKNDYQQMQYFANSTCMDLWRSFNQITIFDEYMVDYLTLTAKPILKWYREHGLQVHLLIANDYSDPTRPFLYGEEFFASAGLPFLSPQLFSYKLMEKDGYSINDYHILYPRYKEEGIKINNMILKDIIEDGFSYIFLDMNEDTDENFKYSLSFSEKDGHLISFKTTGP